MKGCLILFGESFRLGGQDTRNRGSDESYSGQINAAKSHMELLQQLQNQNINMDVYISSYHTKFDEDLKNIYSNNLIGFDFYENLIGVTGLIHNSINKISDIQCYEFIFFMRIDLFLKNRFIEIFNPN